MQELSTPHAAALRRANFFAGTRLDEATASPAREAREREAVAVIIANVTAQAATKPTAAQLDHAATIAQRFVRGLPLHTLHNMASQTGLLADITNQCISAAAVQTIGPASPAANTLTPDHHHHGQHAGDALAVLARRGSDRASSARYLDQLGGGTTVEQARIIEDARGIAIRAGIPWAANQPELLRLGPAAVQILADVHLKEQSYKRLTEEGHFAAKDVVTLGEFAKVRGIKDANALANTAVDVVKLGGTPQEQGVIKDAITGYMKAAKDAALAPTDAAAAQRYEAAGQKQKAVLGEEAKKSQEAYERVRRYEDEAKVEERHRATAAKAEAKADVKVEKADAKVAKAEVKEAKAEVKEAKASADVASAKAAFGQPAKPAAP